ncbi:Mitochondrial glycoprotein [Dillenia turbinata]|uniref:Mitochondrial glycoprotein n=1 Tax=Dillenia turbinata TaxID=194707 RepID=A0AAN8USD3_9MAGN
MARLLQAVRRTGALCPCSTEALIQERHLVALSRTLPLNHNVNVLQSRSYISEMRKSAFQSHILRLLRNEIDYEIELSPPQQPVPVFGPFMVDNRPGHQWVSLYQKFGENEDIKIEVTMFDGSVPISKPGGDEDEKLHISLIANISKGEHKSTLEFVCSAWPNSLEIQNIYMHGQDWILQPYSPEFKDLDDEMQEVLYDYLESRGIDDKLAAFLHECMLNKDKTEFIRWMETVKSFIEDK